MAQMRLCTAEDPPRFDTQTGIPIYRVTLVRERTMPYGQLRSSTARIQLLASTLCLSAV